MRSIVRKLPRYDYIYLGDTKRVPYGNRSAETVYGFLKQAVDYLFRKGCLLIIVACNTASAGALRKIQKTYLPHKFPGRKVLGVIIPTVEAVAELDLSRVGILATQGTVNSKAYIRELKKLKSKTKVFQVPAPLLVPLVEYGGLKWAVPILKEYLSSLLDKKIEALILGCTHYPILKRQIRKIAGKEIKVFSQDEIMPLKLQEYLKRHPEIEKKLSKRGKRIFFATDIMPQLAILAGEWFGRPVALKKVSY